MSEPDFDDDNPYPDPKKACKRLREWVYHADAEIHAQMMEDVETSCDKAEAWDNMSDYFYVKDWDYDNETEEKWEMRELMDKIMDNPNRDYSIYEEDE